MRQRGFSLLEVIVALGILLVAGSGGAQLVALALRAVAQSRLQTQTVSLASERLEQLRGLTFEFDAAGERVTDVTTGLDLDPPGPGGPGLRSAGSDSIAASVGGYVDYLDAQGRWIGNAASPGAGAVFVRRWSIGAWQGSPDLLVLQVLVRPVATSAAEGVRAPGESRFVTILARVRR